MAPVVEFGVPERSAIRAAGRAVLGVALGAADLAFDAVRGFFDRAVLGHYAPDRLNGDVEHMPLLARLVFAVRPNPRFVEKAPSMFKDAQWRMGAALRPVAIDGEDAVVCVCYDMHDVAIARSRVTRAGAREMKLTSSQLSDLLLHEALFQPLLDAGFSPEEITQSLLSAEDSECYGMRQIIG